MQVVSRFPAVVLALVLPVGLITSNRPHAAVASSAAEPLGIPGSWNLVFDDEFDGATLGSDWAPYWFRDGSTQNGTVMSSSNVSVSNGDLDLALTSSSGALVSTNPSGGGRFQFTYGVLEARIYLPGTGEEVDNWPAFWSDGQDWPADGEIDVMEGLRGATSCHFHFPGGGPSGGCPNVGSGWHVFAADWQPGSITYYYDGSEAGVVATGVTSAPMYLVLENAATPGRSTVPSTVEVDYVRVWQAASAAVQDTTPAPSPRPATRCDPPKHRRSPRRGRGEDPLCWGRRGPHGRNPGHRR